MSISTGHVFLVHPGKGEDSPPSVQGSAIELSGNLYDMLQKLFIAQPAEKDFEVVFSPTSPEDQTNPCRELVIAYQQDPTTANGLPLAERLQGVTDNRSGPGLLFLMSGQYGTLQRLVISRFPADQAILAEITADKLNVEFLERVFIRRMSAYKALLLESGSPPDDFWKGTATDRQAGGDAEHISNYWIKDFLQAEFADTPKAGTRRLADALKHAMRSHPSMDVKSQIASAVTLAPNKFDGKMTSIRRFCKDIGFDKNTTDTIVNTLSKPSLAEKEFKFSAKDFKKKLPVRTIEMENGAIMSAPTPKFNSIFKLVKKTGDIVEYRVKGVVADERLQK